MNICLVSREYPPETGWGGIGTYTYNLAHGLTELGHNVHVIAYAPKEEVDYEDKKVNVYRIKEKMPKGLWRLDRLFPISTIFYSIRVADKINELINKHRIEIVEAPEWSAEAFWYSMRKRVPLVIKFHTPHFLVNLIHGNIESIRSRVICWLEKTASLRADFLTSPSALLARTISKKYGISLNKIIVVPNPIDDYLFRPSENDDNQEACVLYVGRLEFRKGVHVLAMAIPKIEARIPNVKFLFIGKDTKTNNKSMKEFISSITANNKVQFIDHISRPDLVAYYQAATICVVPSLWENFPYSGLEAMACGKPVIMTKTTGLSEFIVSRDCVVEPDNPDEIACAIIKLLSDKKLKARICKESAEIAKSLFSQKKIAQENCKIYETLSKSR